MSNVIDVNQGNFQAEVIERSQRTPVVVDFWAPWCGPCRMLGPILERLANEQNSGFILAKLNTDQNQALAMQYGIRGIPAVKAFRDGRVVDEFVGAQPEPMVRQFLQRVRSSAPQQTQTRPQPQAGAQPGKQSPSPARDPAQRLQQAQELLRQGNGCEALSLLEKFPSGPQAAEATRLLPLARFLCRPKQAGAAELDNLYNQAASALRRRDYSAALYNLLTAYNREKGSSQQQAGEIMQAIFTLVGENDPVASQYRQLIAV